MGTITVREAKLRFGEMLDPAQGEPVTIEKHGRRLNAATAAIAANLGETGFGGTADG